ncbi:MAG: ribosome silencing factor [Clostridia bacterium]|nr:ribosome silencing factor [Clostridia bacterium]
MQETRTKPKELAERIIKILDSRKAGEIKLLYTEEKTTLADYFVICSGNSSTQTKGLADEVEYKIGLEGITPMNTEGYESSSWVLLDYGSVVVHIFNGETRQFYNLEKLWHEAEEVDISSLLTED